MILETYVIDSFILAAARILRVTKLFADSLRRLAICQSVNDNLLGKLVSSLELPIIFADNLRTTSKAFFVADLSLSNCEFDHSMFTQFYKVILY